LIACVLCVPERATAHVMDSATLRLTEVAPGRFLMHFQASTSSLARAAAIPAVFPKPCRLAGAYVDCGPGGLVGTIQFPWLDGTLTRLMVEIDWLGGARLLRVRSASASTLIV
jgi:hypothetical protein